jgi:hypothetical protein
MAAELTESNIVFFLCGTFGWSGTPASFQAVSRAIQYEVNKMISGTSDIYVDDLFGISEGQSRRRNGVQLLRVSLPVPMHRRQQNRNQSGD